MNILIASTPILLKEFGKPAYKKAELSREHYAIQHGNVA